MAHDSDGVNKASDRKLPVMIVGPADVRRLINELESIDAAVLDRMLRKPDNENHVLKTSQLMDQIVEQNRLNLSHKAERQELQHFLENVKGSAPVLHMSFSSDPSPAFMSKLMAWLRKEIHPHVLITIGLQPTIGAGCIVRSTNRYFDLSLRQDFTKKHDLLLKALLPEAKGAKP